MISYFRYARYADVPFFQADGWVVCADLGLPHNEYAVLMKWTGEGDPE